MNLHEFISEQKSAGGISIERSNEVKNLWNQYKLFKPEGDCTIISADFGFLGSLVIRRIASFEGPEKTFKYKEGSYDFISVKSDLTTRILWTDYKDIEPYNRQSGLYCNGASFDLLGNPVVEKEKYREFIAEDGISNISFSVWGYDYNDYYKSIQFGICLKTEKVAEFVLKLRAIIGK